MAIARHCAASLRYSRANDASGAIAAVSAHALARLLQSSVFIALRVRSKVQISSRPAEKFRFAPA